MKNIKTVNWRQYCRSALFLANVILTNNYRNTFLGLVWSLLNPVIQVVVFSVVFSHILRFQLENYTLYLVSGILPWSLLTQALLTSSDSLLARSHEIKHCLINKTIFPVANVLNQFYIFSISFFIMYCFLVLVQGGLQWKIALLPLAIIPLLVVCFCGAIAIAYAAPYVRDITHLLNVAFMALFWMTPIVYPISGVPKPLTMIFKANPLYYLLLPVKISTYGRIDGFVVAWILAMFLAILVAIVSYFLYIHLRKRVIYYI